MILKYQYLKNNVYPRSLENIKAIVSYYFKGYKLSEIEEFAFQIYDDNKLSLDRIEYYAYLISQSDQFFKHHLKGSGLTISNLYNYTSQVIEKEEDNWEGSESGKKVILKAYKEFLIISDLI